MPQARWFKALKISFAVTFAAMVLLLIAGNMPNESLVGKILAGVVLVPLSPIAFVMNIIFPGPPHSILVLVTMILLTFVFYTISVWLLLIVIDALRRRNRGEAPD